MRQKLISLLHQAFHHIPGVERAFVFGPEANGKSRPDSDIDVLVIGKCQESDVINASMYVYASFDGREINTKIYSPTEWREMLQTGNAFAAKVETGAKLEFLSGSNCSLDGFASELSCFSGC